MIDRPLPLVSVALAAAAVAAVASLSACGDDLPAPAGSAADSGAGAGTEPDAAPPQDSGGGVATARAFAVGTDFSSTGVASTVAIPELEVTVNAIEGVASTDPVVRQQGDRLFVVNRFGQDNITVIDPAGLALIDQISTGAGSNPQDVALVGDTLYVAALNAPGVLVLDLARPDAGVVDTIDLSELDPADGLPDCGSVVALGDQVVVTCGVLENGQTPRGPGAIALIDGAGGELVQTASLTQIRPFGLVQAARSGEPAVLIPTVDDFLRPAAGGCVERVLIADGTIRPSGCLIENATLGGFVSAIAASPDGDRTWMTVTTSFDPDDFGPYGELVWLPAEGGEPGRVELAEEVRPMDIALCPSGHLVVSDATRGVRVLEPDAAGELTGAPLDIGLPPVSNGLACY